MGRHGRSPYPELPAAWQPTVPAAAAAPSSFAPESRLPAVVPPVPPAPPPWTPPLAWPQAGPPSSAAPRYDGQASESGLRTSVGLAVTITALALSLVLQQGAGLVIHRGDVVDVAVRRAIVLTLVFYLVLGAGLAVFVHRARVRLVWARTGVPAALLLGLPLGLAGGLLGVAINSAGAGHLASDPNVTALVGGGGALRVLLTFLTVSVLAPLVEETVFRGICAGTLLSHGTRVAVWVSAIAFAVWHLNPAALRYYAVMGLVFAALWLKRGLLASMSAHAAFNGVLAVAAVAATTGIAVTTTFGSVSVRLPGGWHTDALHSAPDEVLVSGPAGSGLALLRQPEPAEPSLARIERRLVSSPGRAGFTIDPRSVRELRTGLGDVVTADLVISNQPGHLVEFARDGAVYRLVMVTAGNPAAEREWRNVVDSLQPA